MIAESRKRLLVTSGAVATLVLAMAALSISALRSLERYGRELERTRRALAAAEEQRAALEGERSRRGELETAREELRSFFVDASDPLPFIEAVEALSRSVGVSSELTLLSPAQAAAGTITYRLRARGTYSRIMQFLAAFEELPFAIKLANLSLATAEAAVLPGGSTAGRPSRAPLPGLELELTVKTAAAHADL